ncbi:MAG TPA: response regulator transcription factor [Polyangia bacterium]|nr:response regulator transcription factor [Polyangia bacterium]
MKLLLVDGSTIFRMGLRALFTAASDVSVVGECGEGAEGCALAASLMPDVVLTELHLPDRNGIALTRELARTAPSVRVLVLAAHAPEAIVHQALGAGAAGYILKGQSPEEVLAAVRAVARGELVLPPGVSAPPPRPVGRNDRNRMVLHAIERLSQREREIFDLVVWGASNKQIAGRLGISIKTVETHRGHINGKLRVHTSADIVRLASLWGMITTQPAAADGVAARALPQ